MVNKLIDNHLECPVDIYVYKFIDSHLDFIYQRGFTPNGITTLSILFGLLAAYQIWRDNLIIAGGCWFISYYLDCMDGKLARKYQMVTKFGDLYDHFGDAVKLIAVLVALFNSSPKRTTDKQWLFIGIILLLAIIQTAFAVYQECIYDKIHESPYLNLARVMFIFDKEPHKAIQYAKYMGCGSWNLCFALLIIFWRK